MKKISKYLAQVTLITLLFMVSSCAFFNKLLVSKNKAGVDKTVAKNDKNQATAYESNSLELNMVANSNQTTIVDLLLDGTKASFSIDFQRQGNNNGGSYIISQKDNLDNPNKLTFAGKSGYIKKFLEDDEFDEKAFADTSKIFLQGVNNTAYISTVPNSLTFNDNNFVAFKVENKESNKINYGWLNLVISSSKITIIKMGYLDRLPLSIGN